MAQHDTTSSSSTSSGAAYVNFFLASIPTTSSLFLPPVTSSSGDVCKVAHHQAGGGDQQFSHDSGYQASLDGVGEWVPDSGSIDTLLGGGCHQGANLSSPIVPASGTKWRKVASGREPVDLRVPNQVEWIHPPQPTIHHQPLIYPVVTSPPTGKTTNRKRKYDNVTSVATVVNQRGGMFIQHCPLCTPISFYPPPNPNHIYYPMITSPIMTSPRCPTQPPQPMVVAPIVAPTKKKVSPSRFVANALVPAANVETLIKFTDFYSKYSVGKQIGRGGGGTVFSGKRRCDDVNVAIKKIDMNTVKRWSRLNGKVVPVEFALYNKASANNHGVMEMLDWFEHNGEYLLVMERPEPAMDLFDVISKHGPLSEKAAKFVFKQVAMAAQRCHENGVVHRDIKDENVLINPTTMKAKLIDFGCASRLKEGDYVEFAGTPEFYPPEWFAKRRYNGRRLDAWSLGVLLFTMIESEVPFKEKKDIVTCEPVMKKLTTSHACRDVISAMLSRDEHKRPTLDQILAHPWFDQ